MTTTTTRKRHRDAICPSWCTGHDEIYAPWERHVDGTVRRDHIGTAAKVASPDPGGLQGSMSRLAIGVEQEETGGTGMAAAVVQLWTDNDGVRLAPEVARAAAQLMLDAANVAEGSAAQA